MNSLHIWKTEPTDRLVEPDTGQKKSSEKSRQETPRARLRARLCTVELGTTAARVLRLFAARREAAPGSKMYHFSKQMIFACSTQLQTGTAPMH